MTAVERREAATSLVRLWQSRYLTKKCVLQDFYNLVDVYLDAVLYPNCVQDPKTFAQEGWHYELENPEVSGSPNVLSAAVRQDQVLIRGGVCLSTVCLLVRTACVP